MRPGVANLYEHHLLEFEDKLTRELEPAGYEVWFDRTDIQTGMCWDDEIVKGLDASDDFIVLLSTKSTEAQNVKDEIGYALDHKKQTCRFCWKLAKCRSACAGLNTWISLC